MNIEVILPFYGEDPLRVRNMLAVQKHLDGFGLPRRVPLGMFASPGKARNVAAAHSWEADVIVFNDADTVCPPDQIREAVRLATEQPGLVFAYDLYVRLSETATSVYVDDLSLDPMEMSIDATFTSSGSMGCVAISRECFDQVGGFDESYQGWGYEDLDFAHRCAALWPNRRVSGPVYHLWHGDRRPDDSPSDSDPAQVEANADRFHVKTS